MFPDDAVRNLAVKAVNSLIAGVRNGSEGVSVAGVEGTASILGHCDGAETVVLQLKEKLGIIEGFSLSERHWREREQPSV